MADRTFRLVHPLPVSATRAFDWHTLPGAFERLVPPWEDVRMEGPPAPVEEGAEQVVSFPLGPLRGRWRSRISSVVPGESFQDVQVSGPFARWTHTHTLRDLEGGTSELEDSVAYALPLGPLGALFGGGMVKGKLERMFAYRHRITRGDLERHAAAGDRRLDVLVSGSSGMVGEALCAFLSTGGHRVRRLVRRAPRTADEFRWNPDEGVFDPAAMEGADAVVHLAGENIAGRRWSPRQKDRIRRSRIEGTRLVADAIRRAESAPPVLVSASAVGIYGDRGDEVLDEHSTDGEGYLAEVCKGWEKEAAALSGARVARLRFGVILSPAGGALRKMLLPFLAGAGGRIGSGRQWMSWVALDDVVGAIHHALVNEGVEGAVNVVAPDAVTNAGYTKTLGRVLRRPTIAPTPGAVARLAFGELADELLLASQRVSPNRLLETGYRFGYPELEGALRHQLGRVRGS